MKRLLSMITIAALLIFGALQLTVYGDQAYDTDKTVTRNIYDAIAAIANADNPFLNDVLFVDGDRTDDYTANGSLAAPYKTITTANAAAASGDVIVVAPGAYAEVVAVTAGAHLFGWNVTGATLTGDYVLFNGSTIAIEGAAITINDQSDDLDIRIESDGNANAFVLDAGNDRIGLFTAAPTVPLDVTGEALITGDATITGTGTLGALAVDTDVLSVNATSDITEVNGWLDLPYLEVAASPYTLNAASKASNIIINYTDTGAASLVLASDLLVDGRSITIKDGELNANANNITIGTEGAETIDEANTYVLNANGEAVTLFTDGTNWFVFGGFGE